MEHTQDEDMYLFNAGFEQAATPGSGQIFDDFLLSSPAKQPAEPSPVYMDPNDLTVKVPASNKVNGAYDPRQHNMKFSGSPSGSSSSSSRDSSDSPSYRERKMSLTSADSRQLKQENNAQWSNGFQGMSMPADEEFFADADMSGLGGELETSNQQMASAFDFETAGSTPNAFNPALLTQMPPNGVRGPVRSKFVRQKNGAPLQFFFGGSRETSPMNAMLPSQGHSPWSKHSPSSGLEETFDGITMNGDSPGNMTFSPNLHFAGNGFAMDGESTATPSTFTKDISSPPSTAPSMDGNPILTVYPTSLKSRVETQIPIKMTLHPLPPGITRLRLPRHTVSKPKFLAKPPPERAPDMLELFTSLVCSSAMQDPKKLQRAFARARGEEVEPLPVSKGSPASSSGSLSSKDDEEKPLDGGEVNICSGCIQRERKRASRKKQKKPDEEEMFQRDEEKRVVVFNTNEIKEWVDQSKEPQKGATTDGTEYQGIVPPGVLQVELPMRIACYCRHHNEKMGFQVIFTIKDHLERVIAQAITNTIMITDDHKTHNPPIPLPTPPALPSGPHLPGSGVFLSGMEGPPIPHSAKNFKQSLSTTDLQGLQHNFAPQYPQTQISSNPFAVPSVKSGTTSGTVTPRILSRPPSPGAATGPNTKRRKQSSGKVPSMLAMTRLDPPTQSNNAPTMSNGTAAATVPPKAPAFNQATDRGFVMPNTRPGQYGTSPPTPNGNDNSFMTPVNRSFSMDNLPRQGMISAPNSRQPSRPSSPISSRTGFTPVEAQPPQTMPNQMFASQARRPAPLIHKLVPAEGSILGGTEVTLLGNGFYQGLEVMFGDTEATTTTFWGEKCLNCITPPAIQPGTVTVMFKHEHPQYAQMPVQGQRQSLFTYIDDREVELYRLALKTLGKRLQNPTDDPYAAAQQLLGGSASSLWGMQGNFGPSGGQQRQANHLASAFGDLTDLETNMLAFLETLDVRGPVMALSLDSQRPSGHTLLHLASSLGMTRFVSSLLSKGANPNVLDNNGNTPMHLAAMFGHSHIVHRLRLSGGDHRIRSMRNFIPADLATSLLAHQASVLPNHHYRSRSAGGTPMRLHSRSNSASSLRSFWDNMSASNAYSDSSDESDSDELRDGFTELSMTNSPQASRRRPSGPNDLTRVTSFYPLSRQASGPQMQAQSQLTAGPNLPDEQQAAVTPAAYMMAWRDHLATQIHQYQQSVNWNLPALPSLPTLPTMPDYQDHPMMRRVSSLFPQRTPSRPTTAGGREGWWETLTGSGGSSPSSPPAYDEIFPDQPTGDDLDLKKASAVQAAGDAAFDHHFESLETTAGTSTSVAMPASVTASSTAKPVSPTTRATEVKRIRSDRNLFLIWIPLLVVVLGLMIHNAIPEATYAFHEGSKFLNDFFSSVGKQQLLQRNQYQQPPPPLQQQPAMQAA